MVTPHHQYSKSQLLSVGIFFACSPRENRNDVASVASAAARFPARFPQIHLSVISRDASARDATLFIFNDLWAVGSISNLVGRRGMKKDYFGVRLVQFGLIFIDSPSTQTSVFVAIVKKRLNLEASLYTLLQILSVTLFEKMPLQQAFPDNDYKMLDGVPCNQLNLFAF